MRRFIFLIFGLLSLATGSLSLNIVISSLAGLAISQCGTVTFSWVGGESPYTIACSYAYGAWCSQTPITSDTILSPIDIAGTYIIATGVTLERDTVLIDRPAGTRAYFTVSDRFGDTPGSTDTFTILSSILPLRTHRTANPTSNTTPTLGSAPTSAVDTTQGSTNVGAIAGGAVGGAVVVLLIGLCWWKVQRRKGAGETQTAAASPKVLESAGPKEKGRAFVGSKVAPTMQHADTVGEKFEPSVELYGHRMATPTSPGSRPQDVEASVQGLAYNQTMPTRETVTTNPTPDQIRQEIRPQVEEQGRTRTTFTSGQPAFPSFTSSSLIFASFFRFENGHELGAAGKRARLYYRLYSKPLP
ncbi:hypothetical protein K438DRAFT_1985296 [Mycena galopus ATCC 62051]|nr:hypothetical protein K438DRAFT_1985296 [Mycena galopus ATCC 62051]